MVRLRHPAGVGRRVEQPGAGSHSWEVGEKGRPWLLGVALNANSFCAAWRKLSSGELGLFLGLKQVLGDRSLQERGGVWGADKQELGGREEGPLQRLGEAGRLRSAPHNLQGEPQVESLLCGLASKSLSHGRIGVEQKHGQLGPRELGGPWQMINLGHKGPKAFTQSW